MKRVILIAALVVPGLIFIFLKLAGRNEFNITVWYEDGLPAKEGCEPDQSKPYVVPPNWNAGNRAEANVLIFPSEHLEGSKIIAQLLDEFPQNVRIDAAAELAVDSTQLNSWMKCAFRVEPPWQTVLIDKPGRIRGYYDLRSRDEVDRIRVELKILLKKY